MTEENKTEYLELVCNWQMSSGNEEQTKSFLTVIPVVISFLEAEEKCVLLNQCLIKTIS